MHSKIMEREFHVVVWGATGFTGKLVAKFLFSQYGEEVRFAIAGRSASKLEQVQQWLKQFRDDDSRPLPEILVGNASDQQSIDDVVRQARAVITCVGPYTKYGEPVVDSCVRLGTHYVDITGEPNFVQDMIDKYHDQAVRNNVMIVSQCGFDSIPSDLGTLLLANHVKTELKSELSLVRAFVAIKGAASGGTISTAFEMASLPLRRIMHVFLNPNTLYSRDKRGGLENLSFVDAPQIIPKYEWDQGFWSGFNPLGWANTLIVRRSNVLSAELFDSGYGTDFHYQERLQTKHFVSGAIQCFLSLFALFLSVFVFAFGPLKNWARTLLPAAGEGPSEEMMETGWLKITFIGDTLEGKSASSRVTLKNHDPGYKGTSMMVAEAGLCLALDQDKLSAKGGCLTPAVAMGDTLIKRLQNRGMKFEIL